MWRDLALFNLAIDSKLRASDLVKLRTVRYLGIEVDDALHIAEQIELQSSNPAYPGGRLRAKDRPFSEKLGVEPNSDA
jgi:hypothetical protein